MAKTLVTGGLGFIGRRLTRHLLEAGREVVVLDLEPSGDEAAAAAAWQDEHPGCVRVEADVRDRRAVDRLYRRHGLAATAHLAAFSRARESVTRPRETAEVNELGTVTLLEAARRWGAYTFVLASSASVYGADAPRPFDEEALGEVPNSPYGASKRAGELHALACGRVHGLKVTALRLFSVFGPGQRPDQAVARFVDAATRGTPGPRFGDGGAIRDPVWVDDVVRAFELALDKAPDRLVCNISGGRGVTVTELAQAVATACDRPLDLEDLPEQPGDAPSGHALVERAAAALGWHPKTGLAEGLQRLRAS